MVDASEDAAPDDVSYAVKGRFLREVWYGRRSLATTFWLWWTVAVVVSVALFLGGALAANAAASLLPLYLAVLVAVPLQVWAWVGTWRSATRNGSAWGAFAKLAVVLALVYAVGAPIIAIPGLLQARSAGYRASAIGSLRTIATAQAAFRASCGNGSYYAPSLSVLATPPDDTSVPFVAPDLATDPSVKSGYRITLVPGPAAADAPAACGLAAGRAVRDFFATAAPVEPGTLYLAATSDGTIYQSPQPIPPTFGAPPPPPALPLQ